MNIEQQIEQRRVARENKDFALCDKIRDILDSELVFIFDVKDNNGDVFQEIHYLCARYFKNKNKSLVTAGVSNRQYVEVEIKKNIKANKNFDAWLFSINKSI